MEGGCNRKMLELQPEEGDLLQHIYILYYIYCLEYIRRKLQAKINELLLEIMCIDGNANVQ